MRNNLFILIPFLSIMLGCEKDSTCGEDIVIDTLHLSTAVEEGLLLRGTERIVFNDGEGNRMIFRSSSVREYKTKRELLYVLCENDDFLNYQYEVVETENYSIKYTDSLDALNVMMVNAEMSRMDSILIEKLEITIQFGDKIQSHAPLSGEVRFNVLNRKKYDVSTVIDEEDPFQTIVFDTIFNNQPYTGVTRFYSYWGDVFYNRQGVLQFKEIGDKVWTIESIN